MEALRLLFLDIDGVLNDGKPTESGYQTIQYDKVRYLNDFLDACPNVQIVISSSWRYLVLGGQMTLNGFESMLLTYGLKVRGRLHGVTEFDHERDRDELIRAYVDQAGCNYYAVLDDLALPIKGLVKTETSVGLTRDHLMKIINYLYPNHE